MKRFQHLRHSSRFIRAGVRAAITQSGAGRPKIEHRTHSRHVFSSDSFTSPQTAPVAILGDLNSRALLPRFARGNFGPEMRLLDRMKFLARLPEQRSFIVSGALYAVPGVIAPEHHRPRVQNILAAGERRVDVRDRVRMHWIVHARPLCLLRLMEHRPVVPILSRSATCRFRRQTRAQSRTDSQQSTNTQTP